MSLQSDLYAMFNYAAMLSEQRARRRQPVIVEGRLFSSMTDAAYWLAHYRRDLWENTPAAQEKDAYRVMCSLISRVRRWCNDYTYRHIERQPLLWCLAEDGDPETWDNPPGVGDDNWVIEDLRK